MALAELFLTLKVMFLIQSALALNGWPMITDEASTSMASISIQSICFTICIGGAANMPSLPRGWADHTITRSWARDAPAHKSSTTAAKKTVLKTANILVFRARLFCYAREKATEFSKFLWLPT